ncbi:MAG: hypothetical protein JXA89_02130 [Anaerolineae bacterium]|nr:hypothetical protein [Anaerolineae bacterium]
MYIGHFAVGLTAKPAAPKVSLGISLVATQVLDILYAILLLVGVNQADAAGPWDHGLVMSLVWSAVTCAISFLFYRDIRSSIVVGLLVLSHWVCDFISWDHALPLAFGNSPRVGLGLYNSIPVMLALDFGLFGGAFALYLFRTKANDRTGKWAPWLLVAYLIALIPTSLLPGKLLIIMALGMALLAPFGWWIDQHRSLVAVNCTANRTLQ